MPPFEISIGMISGGWAYLPPLCDGRFHLLCGCFGSGAPVMVSSSTAWEYHSRKAVDNNENNEIDNNSSGQAEKPLMARHSFTGKKEHICLRALCCSAQAGGRRVVDGAAIAVALWPMRHLVLNLTNSVYVDTHEANSILKLDNCVLLLSNCMNPIIYFIFNIQL
ncbi:hypothetical protein CEXT_724181 [Caerostris extrusa]|uniref:G-protein coupled receptors family 1 profile domain-containing protein n=1 Tax=Caerostris extrusa TaxID=172846 RepID=A0AAV4PGF4_CAEEX|nr:hypothetical protein CEXT_724181 [Caerostris extrusa]